MITADDCSLDGHTIDVQRWPLLNSLELSRIVGCQHPGESPEYAHEHDWRFEWVPLDDLRFSNQDLEEPDGGWVAAHARHLASDAMAVATGSPAYAGRANWLLTQWGKHTEIYPLFMVQEPGSLGQPRCLRIWDGHRRVAAAFAQKLSRVAALVGTPALLGGRSSSSIG